MELRTVTVYKPLRPEEPLDPEVEARVRRRLVESFNQLQAVPLTTPEPGAGSSLTVGTLERLWRTYWDYGPELQAFMAGERDHVLLPDGFVCRTPDGQLYHYTEPTREVARRMAGH